MEVTPSDKLSVNCVVNSFKSSNTYIISKEGINYVWLIDVGEANKILEAIGEKNVAGILITHAHLDHIYGLQTICDCFPQCEVYGSAMAIEYLFDDKKNLSFYYDRPLRLSLSKLSSLNDGDVVKIFDNTCIKCIHTPGHTLDSASYQLERSIFTGDAFIPGVPTVTKLRGGDKIMAAKSISIIKSYVDNGYCVYCGHTVLK